MSGRICRARRAALLAPCLLGTLPAAAPLVAQEPHEARLVTRPVSEGQLIADQNIALQQAMRALEAANPEAHRVTLYVTRKQDDIWHVYFGSLDFENSEFNVAYEAVQAAPTSEEFLIIRNEVNVPADEEVSGAAMALFTALDAFEPPQVTFYSHVFRDEDGRWVTYFLPDPVLPGALPQQVDMRVVVAPDATQVLESTRFYADVAFQSMFETLARREARRRAMERAQIERFVDYYLPRALTHPQVAPGMFLLLHYSCSYAPPARAPGCWLED